MMSTVGAAVAPDTAAAPVLAPFGERQASLARPERTGARLIGIAPVVAGQADVLSTELGYW